MSNKNFRPFLILFLAMVLSFTGFSPVLAAPPTNDNFAGAAEVTSFPFSATVDISEATDELDEPQACHFMDRTVWFAFTPTERMRVRADTLGSFIQGNVNVYLGSGGGITDLQFIECS